MSERLVASAQYDDFEGTAAADEDMPSRDISSYLKQQGVYDPECEGLIAVEMWVGESQGNQIPQPRVTAIISNPRSFEEIKALLSKGDQPKLRKVEIDLSLNQFFGFYKRFSVVLTRRGLDLSKFDLEIDQ